MVADGTGTKCSDVASTSSMDLEPRIDGEPREPRIEPGELDHAAWYRSLGGGARYESLLLGGRGGLGRGGGVK